MAEPKWEIVVSDKSNDQTDVTERLRVPGGFIYRSVFWGGDRCCETVAMVFVPEPPSKD